MYFIILDTLGLIKYLNNPNLVEGGETETCGDRGELVELMPMGCMIAGEQVQL